MIATEKTTTVFIKNMVCDRCIMAVHKTIEEMGLKPIDVKLGSATVEGAIDDNQRQGLRKKLQSIGFELLDDQRQRTIEQIRTAIIQLVHYNDNNSPANLSSYLSEKLGQDYSALSKLFSEYASKTIEGALDLRRTHPVADSPETQLFEHRLSLQSVQGCHRNDAKPV